MSDDIRYRLPPFTVQTVVTSLAETTDWSLAAYHIPQHWRDTQGAGIKVAVLDTGVEEQHPDLAAAIEATRDFTRSRHGVADRQGHGTHVAGTIAARANDVGVIGVAPQCRLLVAKVLGDDGSGSSAAVAAGIDWAVDQDADILSLSLGSPEPSPDMHAAIQRAVERGTFVICAAGNEGRDNSVNFPARWLETVAVGAVNRDGVVTRFSSRGPEVDIAAPGENILSTYLNRGYAKLSGTSMATPFVTGVVALMLAKHRAHGGQTPIDEQTQLLEHLRRTATDAGPAGPDPSYGFGLINPDSVLATPAPTPAPGAPQIVIHHVTVDGLEGAFIFQPR